MPTTGSPINLGSVRNLGLSDEDIELAMALARRDALMGLQEGKREIQNNYSARGFGDGGKVRLDLGSYIANRYNQAGANAAKTFLDAKKFNASLGSGAPQVWGSVARMNQPGGNFMAENLDNDYIQSALGIADRQAGVAFEDESKRRAAMMKRILYGASGNSQQPNWNDPSQGGAGMKF